MGEQISSRTSVLDKFSIGAVLLVFLVTLGVVRPFGDFPLLDDWVYARSAVATAAAGRFVFSGWESAWGIPQIAVGAIVTRLTGTSHLWLRSLGILSAVGVTLVMNAYLRKREVRTDIRALLCAVLLFNPVVYLLSMTFMSDVPFLALWLAACFAWDSALTDRKGGWVIMAVLFSTLAMAQRQFGIVIPGTVLVLLVCALYLPGRAGGRRRDLVPAFAAVVVTFAIGVCLYVWKSSQGVYQPPVLWSNPFTYFGLTNLRMIILLTLALLPAAVLIGSSKGAPRPYVRCGVVLSLLATLEGIKFVVTGESILFGNLLSPLGITRQNEILLGERPVLFTSWMNVCALGVALGAFWLTIPAILRSSVNFFKKPAPAGAGDGHRPFADFRFGAVLVGSTLVYLGIFALRGGFDRYLIPALPGLMLVAAGGFNLASKRRLLSAYALLLGMMVLAVALSYDYYRWNEVKWRVASDLVRSGVPSAKIHAGYEWHGWYHGDTAPFPGGLDSGYSHFVSFSDTFDALVAEGELRWISPFPPFHRTMFVLRSKGSGRSADPQ